MPELPEIRAHAERLSAAFGGAVLDAFSPLTFTVLKTFDPPPEAAVGQPLDEVGSRGKYLLLRFGALTFAVHLMQGGRLRESGEAKRPKGALARWDFGARGGLLLSEAGTERRAGVWVLHGDPLVQAPLAELGPEADGLDAEALGQRLAGNAGRLHTVLRDQHVVAGIGRRLANEVCHRARLSPFTSTRRLEPEQVEAVHRAIAELVAEGMADERTRTQMSASADRPAAVHAKAGQPCPVCGDIVRAIEYRDYTISYCATCQTDGRVLADNTLSKFGITDAPPRPARPRRKRR